MLNLQTLFVYSDDKKESNSNDNDHIKISKEDEPTKEDIDVEQVISGQVTRFF
jgi:hypothetical protein